MAAREIAGGEGIAAAVVSLPCWELFAAQDDGYRAGVLGGAPRFGIEAAGGFGWERWLGPDGVFIGMTGFGASAPFEDLYRHFGITAGAIVAAVPSTRRNRSSDAIARRRIATISRQHVNRRNRPWP